MKEVKLRIEDSVWKALRKMAEADERSINREVLFALKSWLHLRDRLEGAREDQLLAEVGMDDYDRLLQVEDNLR